MQIEPKDYTVVVTEIDVYSKQSEVLVENGCRFTTWEDGSLVVLDANDREISAWAKGRWVKVGTRLEAAGPPDPPPEDNPSKVVKSG